MAWVLNLLKCAMNATVLCRPVGSDKLDAEAAAVSIPGAAAPPPADSAPFPATPFYFVTLVPVRISPRISSPASRAMSASPTTLCSEDHRHSSSTSAVARGW